MNSPVRAPDHHQSIGARLFALLAEENSNENVAVSPASITAVLKVLSLGAAGHTRQLLETALASDERGVPGSSHIKGPGNRTIEFDTATSVWVRSDVALLPAFVESANRMCAAVAKALPKTAPEIAVNNWVSEKTRGCIREIMRPYQPLDLLTLVNAAYFKGWWTFEFDEALTRDGDFQLPDGSRKSVPFMKETSPFNLHRNEQFDWVRLPYGYGRFAMDLLLPRAPRFEPDHVFSLLSLGEEGSPALQSIDQVCIELPRFSLDSESSLTAPLKSLGLEEIFDFENADFSNMVSDMTFNTIPNEIPLAVGEVQHKIYLAVDESGTEAAGATALMLAAGSISARQPPPPPVVRFDRPFLLAIRDVADGHVLFTAAVRNPSDRAAG